VIDTDALNDLQRQARYILYDTSEDERDQLATLALVIASVRRAGISSATRNALDADTRTMAPELLLAIQALDQLAKTITH